MWQFQPRTFIPWYLQLVSPLIAVCLTILLGMGLFSFLGKDPLHAMYVFFISPLSDGYNVGELLVKTAPMLLCAVGLALCYQANLWNIGAEGQLLLGAVVGSAVSLQFADSSMSVWLAMIAGVLAGMAWSGIAIALRQWVNSNIILTTIMLNYIALYTLQWAVHGPLKDPEGMGFPESALFADTQLLPILIENTRVHLGVLFALLAAILSWILLRFSWLGFQIRVLGHDESSAHYAGFSIRRLRWGIMLFSGALAGLAGASEVSGPIGQLIPAVSPGYGYAAIIVAWLGRLHPLGMCVSGLFLGLIYMGGDMAQIELGVPTAITGLFQGSLLFLLLASDFLLRYRLVKVKSKETQNG